MSGNRHAAELRRRILVENPVIVRFMAAEQRIERLVEQLNGEYREIRDIVKYVKTLDRATAKVLRPKSSVKRKAKKTKAFIQPKYDNVIPFPRQKKSTKAA